MDDEDDYFDTLSMNSETVALKRDNNNKRYISLSRHTIYHSVPDLDRDMELAPLDGRGGTVKKRWRSFSNCDLSVDFVLAYDEHGKHENVRKREVFEKNLETVGLILEREENQKIHFVKMHVPRNVLCQYAEILKMRLPIKDDEAELLKDNLLVSTANKLMDCCKVSLDPNLFPPKKYQLTAEFSRDKSYLFNVDDPEFFNSSIRITVASYILEREKFGDEDQDKGIKRLIAEDVYKAAYPLHDGDLHDKDSRRKLLLDEWASVSKCIKFQPIDEIKDYFGVKFALYFSWLGFYTHMLIPAAVVGVICFLYGVFTLKYDTLSVEICKAENIVMCPRCYKICDYWKLSESCSYSKVQHLIDNPATIFFAVFMSIWGTVYLEMWKRYSAEITHRWGLTGFDLQAEPPRPEYLMRLSNAKKKKINVITQLQEPVVPFWRVKLPSLILSFAIASFWSLVALGVVVGVVVYRMSCVTSGVLVGDKTYLISVTAALINLVCIVILNLIYDRMAEWLTEMELQRTQTEFDESLSLKIYMFQFVNYYSAIFYIAFFKGKFVGYPAKYNKVFGYRQEECNPGGCLMELTIQLAIIMIGNQTVNGAMEMLIPFLLKMYNTFKVTTGLQKKAKTEEVPLITCNQWTEDYKLGEFKSRSLFSEYMEMVLQYGFVTIFVAAFPLAPFLALVNNILEMRLDAKKFIKYYRRPVPQRVKNIGVWYSILAIIGRISVASNAFIIAFSSHFIPLLVYNVQKYKGNGTAESFLEFNLASFNTSDFPASSIPESATMNVSVCRYAEFRNPHDYPDVDLRYKRSTVYWHILAARLAFIVVYQNLVGFVMTVVEWVVPDVSRKLNDRIKREAYRTNETIIKHEMEMAKKRSYRDGHKRDSLVSGVSVYYDANGHISGDDQNSSRRSTRYYDT